MANNKMRVEQYPPEYLEFLKIAAVREIEIDFSKHYPPEKAGNQAFYVRARINSLRTAMRKEGHPDSAAVMLASLSITKDRPHILVGRPRDSKILEAFHAAGVKRDVVSDSVLDQILTPQPDEFPISLKDLSPQDGDEGGSQ